MPKVTVMGETSQYKIYDQRYNRARGNLLVAALFTVINLVLLVLNTGRYFLFSASVPYYVTYLGMLFCGYLPEEYYEGLGILEFADNSLFVVLLSISIAIILLYLLAWFMSRKKRVGWLVFALVLFCIDTAAMLILNGFLVDSLIDLVFHIAVIVYLALGISACNKLKKLPPEEKQVSIAVNLPESDEAGEVAAEPVIEDVKNSPILRRAEDVKHRVLLETNVLSYDICYRRVKHTNELVVNGNVYDELEGIIESAHVLKAWVGGHYIEVGNDGYYSFISLNGNVVARKRRLF